MGFDGTPKVHFVPERNSTERLPSLGSLLETLDLLDKQLVDMPMTEVEAVVKEQIPQKVDATFHFLDSLEIRIEQLRFKARAMYETARILENKHESVREYLGSKMVEHGFEKLPGNEYDMGVKTSPSVHVMPVEFTPAFISQFGKYIRVKYEISKEAVKDALDAGETLPFATIEKTHRAKFSVRRIKSAKK